MCACRHILRGRGLLKPTRDFSEAQGLRLYAPNKVAWVPSLVRKLRSHMLCGIARKTKEVELRKELRPSGIPMGQVQIWWGHWSILTAHLDI